MALRRFQRAELRLRAAGAQAVGDLLLLLQREQDVGVHADGERAVLRIAAFELLRRPDVPYRVVINEAIETTKRFGADQGHTYVNGVLDKAAAEWRPHEFNARR